MPAPALSMEQWVRRGWSVRALIQLLAATLAVGASPLVVPAQTMQPTALAPDSVPLVTTVDPSLVNVSAVVSDEDGYAVTGLKRDNFRIYDDGEVQSIVDFAPASDPVTIVVLMEYSSAYYGYFADKAAWWATRFLDHLEPHDWVALATYDLNAKVRVDFTHNRYEVRDAINTLGPPFFSEANLFDAVTDTLDKLERVSGKKSILLIATGSNSFSANTLDDVLDRLKRTDVTVFCVGLAEGEYVRSGSIGTSYMQARNWLTTFARQTGGVAMFPRFDGELPSIFSSVVGFLHSEYSLTFRPAPEHRDGRYHRLRVEVVGPDGKPLKVTNEKGKRRDVEVYAREGYVAAKSAER